MAICKQRRFFLLLIFMFYVVVSSKPQFAQGHGVSVGTRFELIHRNDYLRIRRDGLHPISRVERLRASLHSDTIRVGAISRKIKLMKHGGAQLSRRHLQEDASYDAACSNSSGGISSGQMTIHSGADFGTGQYFVHLKVGSPAQKVVLIADTGSDLTWMNCRYRCRGRRCRQNSNNRRSFRADDSSTFKTVPCSSSTCKIELANLFSLARCPSPMNPCAYDYRYSDGSSAVGLFANETITIDLTNGETTKLDDVLVGCTQISRGQSFESADGLIGLGYSNYSFAVKAAKSFGGKFSYCLVDHLSPRNVSSYLIFGSHQQTVLTTTPMQYTDLILGVIPPFYAVNINGISLGGKMLEIPSEVWNVSGQGGAIVDSGTSLTFLTLPAYEPVMNTLKLSLLGFENLNLSIGPLEYCFNSTGFDESLVPRLAFFFSNGAVLEPPVKSYIIDAAPEVKCVGFVAAAWPGTSVIGNIMQQNHIWEFDIEKGRLGFSSSSCT